MKNFFRIIPARHKGFTMVEIIVVIGVLSLVISSVTIFAIDSSRFSLVNTQRIQASLLMQEATSAIIHSKNDLWGSIVDNTGSGDKHMIFSNNTFQIQNGPLTIDDTTISFQINTVQRDSSGNIVSSGGTEDIATRVITMNAFWTDQLETPYTISTTFYVNSWNTPSWKKTLQAEFETGTTNDTIVTATGDGAVELNLEDAVSADWCLPFLTATTYDLQRQGVPTSIAGYPNHAYMGTGGNSSGPTLDHAAISSDDPPIVTQLGTMIQNFKVNDIYVPDLNYTYLATDSNEKEAVIVQISSEPYTETGYFDATSSLDGQAIFISGNVGLLTQGSTLMTFDISSKTGARPQLDAISLIGTGSDIMVNGNYAFISISGSSTEMQIIDITNPADIFISGYADVNGQAATSIYVKEDGSRVYLGTINSATEREFFIIDTSSKTGSRPIIASADTNGMSVKDLSVIDARAVLVGTGGEEYQVFRLELESSPLKCGGMENEYGLYGLETIVDSINLAWAYVLTGNTMGELVMVLGGEYGGGGGQGQGDQYVEYGDYTSDVFDSGLDNTRYYAISWNEQILANTDIKFQIRAGTTADLSAAAWIGPDGTNATFFTNSLGEMLPSSAQNKRYIQFKAYFYSNKVYTPVLESVKINYQHS